MDRNEFSDGGASDALGGSEYFTGGCGCGGVEGGGLDHWAAGIKDSVLNFTQDPIANGTDLILMAVVIICVIVVILNVMASDINMTAFSWTMLSIGAVALVIKGLWWGYSLAKQGSAKL